ncbi:MAG: hypothetical protein HOI95_05960 [Chromatiales bacterium]|nr:hypothetical protein [Chromatiales bacterium]
MRSLRVVICALAATIFSAGEIVAKELAFSGALVEGLEYIEKEIDQGSVVVKARMWTQKGRAPVLLTVLLLRITTTETEFTGTPHISEKEAGIMMKRVLGLEGQVAGPSRSGQGAIGNFRYRRTVINRRLHCIALCYVDSITTISLPALRSLQAEWRWGMSV